MDSIKETLAWLAANPPLNDLVRRFPSEWERSHRDALAQAKRPDAPPLAQRLARAVDEERAGLRRLHARPGNTREASIALSRVVEHRMFRLAMKEVAVAAASGGSVTPPRLRWWEGALLQPLLFRRGLIRKPVSLRGFRWLWPMIRRRRSVMPMLMTRGIYCFYSDALIRALAALIGDRPCLEIAAGDGALTTFLAEAGVTIRATDSHAWTHAVTYPATVEKLSAQDALTAHRPRAVICSWPPPGNDFERHVFRTPSVDLYIVLGSRHSHATGDRAVYADPPGFIGRVDDALSRLILPPELDGEVCVFRRATSAT
jgi:hypothetical protein